MIYRSTTQRLSRREAIQFTKAVHAKAHKDCITNAEALADVGGYRCFTERTWTSRPGLIPGSTYVNHVKIEDGVVVDLRDEDVYDFQVDFPAYEPPKRKTDMTVSLLDIARPAKRKGPAKHFEVIPKARHVITDDDVLSVSQLSEFVDLEDVQDAWSEFSEFDAASEAASGFEDEEWEDIYEDEKPTKAEPKRTYSAVARGKER